MAHYKEEQWYKNLSKALESFTSDWHKDVKKQKIGGTTCLLSFNKDINHQKKAGALGAVKGGQIAGRNNVISGQIFEAQKLSRSVKNKKFKQRNIFEIFKNDILIGQYPRIVDIANAYGCSVSQMSLYISHKKPFPNGYVFTKTRIREMSKSYLKRKQNS
jgi:hypothetical protein